MTTEWKCFSNTGNKQKFQKQKHLTCTTVHAIVILQKKKKVTMTTQDFQGKNLVTTVYHGANFNIQLYTVTAVEQYSPAVLVLSMK